MWSASMGPGEALAEESGWREAPFDRTLKALRPNQLLLVEIGADWCEPCNQLAMEVLDTPAGAQVIGVDVGLRVDFESDEGQELKRRYGVLSLPTLLYIHREGFEVGRVEGYPGRSEWLEAVREAHGGRNGLEALRKLSATRPGDLALAIDLAQAQLVRRETAVALKALERIIDRSAELPDLAARAARIKGRWLLRVREDGKAAIKHFLAMVERFAGTRHEDHFRYWCAESYEAIGDTRRALDTFEDWSAKHADRRDVLAMQAGFMVHHEYPPEAVLRVLDGCEDTAQVSYLKARIKARMGEHDAAKASISDAVRREPDNALYLNWQRRLEGLR